LFFEFEIIDKVSFLNINREYIAKIKISTGDIAVVIKIKKILEKIFSFLNAFFALLNDDFVSSICGFISLL